MLDQKGMLVYSKATECEEKFDYFVAAITGAILAYSLQSYEPAKWDLDAQTLEPIALIILLFSFFLGLLRIQSAVSVAKYNMDSPRAGELASDLKEAFENGIQGCTEPGTGITYDRSQIPALFEKYQEREVVANAGCEKAAKSAHSYYFWRNRLLVVGFGVLLISKILDPYWN